MLENAVPLATGQVLAELPRFKPDFLVESAKHSLFTQQNFTQLLFYQFSWDDCNTQEKSKTRVMQNVAR